MGVTGMWEYLQRFMTRIDVHTLQNKRIAIDGHGWLCEVVRGSVAHSSSERKPHLSTFYSRCRCLIGKGIEPIVVFDGFDDALQTGIEGNAYVRRKDRKRVSKVGSPESKLDVMSKIEEIKSLLNTMGVRWMTSKLEGAAQCAQLEQRGIVHGCITRDYDYILFGGSNLYQVEFNIEGYVCASDVLHLSMEHIQKVLCVSRSCLIAMSIMMGCDYYQKGIPGVGLVTALEITSEFYLMEHDHPQVILDRFKSYTTETLPQRDYDSNIKQKLRASVMRNSIDLRGFNPNSESISNTVNIYLVPTVIEYSRTQLPKKLQPDLAKTQEILFRECNWNQRLANMLDSTTVVEDKKDKTISGKFKEEKLKCSKRELAALDRLRVTASLYKCSPVIEVISLPSMCDDPPARQDRREYVSTEPLLERATRRKMASDDAATSHQTPAHKVPRKDRSVAAASPNLKQAPNLVNGASELAAVGDQSSSNNMVVIDDVAHTNALQVIQSTA